MIYIMLIPFDVFRAARHFDSRYSFRVWGLGIRGSLDLYDLYFICYTIMIFMSFVGLPFSYFYAQSVQDDEDLIDSITAYSGSGQRLKSNGMDSSETSSEDEDAENEIDLG